MTGYTTAGAKITGVSGTAQHPTSGKLTGEFLTANHLKNGDFASITTSGAADNTQFLWLLVYQVFTSLPNNTATPLTVIARMARQMDTANVDSRDRWLVIDPILVEILKDEDSRLVNADFGGNGELMNGLVANNIHGFKVYVSNALPSKGTGAGTSGVTANQDLTSVVILAGQMEAVASAEQINKVENYRDPDSFADIVRGMHLYGRKILRPQALVSAKYNVA